MRRTELRVPSEVRERVALNVGKRTGDVWANLAVLVGIPYLKRKLDEAYDVHVAPSQTLLSGSGPQYVDRDALLPNPTIRQRILWYYKWFLRRVYPSINAAYYFSILAFSLAYLFDGTKYSSPFLWVVSTRMKRMGEADFRAIAEAGDKRASKLNAGGRPGQGLAGIMHPRTVYPRLLSSLKILLPTSIFALKFLEWWHASDFARQLSRKATEGLELPPPIVSGLSNVEKQKAPIEKGADGKQESRKYKSDPPVSSTSYLPIFTVPLPPSSDLCPICLHPISTAAACQTGYVYDYKCIFQWIEGSHERQDAFMKGESMSEWDDDNEEGGESQDKKPKGSQDGKWESGMGRCAVTGRRVLGGTGGLRRVMV